VDWRAAWDGAWKVSSLDILELQVVFRKASESAPQPVTLQEKKRGWLPERFELGFLRAERGTVTFQSEAGEAQVAVSNSVLTLEPKGRSFEVAAKGGTLSVQHLPTMELESANARLSEATLHLTDSHVRLGATGKVTGSGEFGKNSRLQITFEGVDPAPFLSEEWKQRLTGKPAGDALLEWPEDGRMRASGKFLLTEARLEKIPLLDQIAKFTSSPQFRRMPLQEVTGNFVKENGLLTVTNFVGESKGLLKTTGDFTISDEGPVSGEFLIGVSPQVLQWVPGSREKVFKENRDGYVWAPITIGGTMKHPTEDLTGRLKAAMAEEVIDQGAKILEVVPEGVTDGVKEGAKGLLDAVNPLFGR
jgi:hypothetical protein